MTAAASNGDECASRLDDWDWNRNGSVWNQEFDARFDDQGRLTWFTIPACDRSSLLDHRSPASSKSCHICDR